MHLKYDEAHRHEHVSSMLCPIPHMKGRFLYLLPSSVARGRDRRMQIKYNDETS
jgi:hypothetical protein